MALISNGYLTSWNCFAGYSRQSVCGLRIPAAAMHASILPSRSPIISPTFQIASYPPIPRVSLRSTTTTLPADAYLVRNIGRNVLQPRLAFQSRHPREVFLHLVPLWPRLFREVDAVHRPRAGLCERRRHLEPEPAIRARDECNAVRERELVREERRLRRCGISGCLCGTRGGRARTLVWERLERCGDADWTIRRERARLALLLSALQRRRVYICA